MRICSFTASLVVLTATTLPAQKPRAHDIGVPFAGTRGALNAITDVAGVEVWHSTIMRGEGRLEVGQGPVRTGVTAILPRGRTGSDTVFAGWFTLNGNGEMTGTIWVEDSGVLEGPVLITNTSSVGVVRDAVIQWMMKTGRATLWALPVVAETYDGTLNDDKGFHVKPEHVFEALEGARGGGVAEGNVGGGTGMICHRFKGGIGTSSRKLSLQEGGYTVGVLVQCNYGQRRLLTVAGAPVGQEITDLLPCWAGGEAPTRAWVRERYGPCEAGGGDGSQGGGGVEPEPLGSIIIVVATDAPLLPHQLKRVARRAALGVGRMGGLGENGSGDIFIAFSTANARAAAATRVERADVLPNDALNPIYEATVQATEEAILNALLAAESMTGADGVRVQALPPGRLLDVLRKYGRLSR